MSGAKRLCVARGMCQERDAVSGLEPDLEEALVLSP